MNTRLQVEHPVTELVTGLDLVEWQLRVAAGEGLPLTQDELELRGHAIEARLYAEDPAAGFVPQTGRVHAWEPAEGPGLRVDHGLLVGVGRGQRIGSDYDPMVAKVVAHGRDREEARRRLMAGLRRTLLLGPTDNKRFLLELLDHPTFVGGDVTTSFVEHDPAAAGIGRGEPAGVDPEHAAVAAALWLGARANAELVRPGLPASWRSAHDSVAWIELRVGETLVHSQLRPTAEGGWSVAAKIAGEAREAVHVRVLDQRGARVRVSTDGHQREAFVAWTEGGSGGELLLELDGQRHSYAEHRPHEAAETGTEGGDGVVAAPTMGKVLAVLVEAGARVEPGDALLTLEAMKIESTISAGVSGTVSELRVAAGDQVDKGQLLITIEPEADSDTEPTA
jgi:geranyl-CoA carboxylase alpha subunit